MLGGRNGLSLLDLVGWVGSAILVWSLLQTRVLRLRLINLVGSLILVAFNVGVVRGRRGRTR